MVPCHAITLMIGRTGIERRPNATYNFFYEYYVIVVMASLILILHIS